MNVRFDDRGLVVAVVQDRVTGDVRMVAWMNAEALERTLSSGFATFYSRSRERLWTKGETSGNRLKVREVWLDCDQDTVLLLADPEGPSCHTGRVSCFFRDVEGTEQPLEAQLVLGQLRHALEARKRATAAQSYTKSLFEGGAQAIGGKLREEADELSLAIANESDERVVAEAADLLFHALVGLSYRGLSLDAVIEVLAARAGTSGHREKAGRTPES